MTGIAIVCILIGAIFCLALLSTDENYETNYYVCEECHSISCHRKEVRYVTCAICGIAKIRIKNY